MKRTSVQCLAGGKRKGAPCPQLRSAQRAVGGAHTGAAYLSARPISPPTLPWPTMPPHLKLSSGLLLMEAHKFQAT